MLELPAGAADRAADPLRGIVQDRGGLRVEGDVVPEHERVVLLHADAWVRPDLRLEDAGGGAGALGERAGALLEQIERVEGCGAISQAADNQHDRVCLSRIGWATADRGERCRDERHGG